MLLGAWVKNRRITQRSQVQILPPLPTFERETRPHAGVSLISTADATFEGGVDMSVVRAPESNHGRHSVTRFAQGSAAKRSAHRKRGAECQFVFRLSDHQDRPVPRRPLDRNGSWEFLSRWLLCPAHQRCRLTAHCGLLASSSGLGDTVTLTVTTSAGSSRAGTLIR